MEVVIEGKFYRNGAIERGFIGIKDGRIAAIKKEMSGDKTYHIKRGIILPGGMDSHVHFRDPGATHKEDFDTGTLSSLFGGITTILDMPNNSPAPVISSILKEKEKAVARKAWIDYGLFGGLTSDTDIEEMAGMVPAFKLYMGSTTDARPLIHREEFSGIIKRIMKAGSIISVHAEDEKCLGYYRQKMRDTYGDDWKEKSPRDHTRVRPVECEVKAVESILNVFYRMDILREGARLHVCHVSSPDVLNTIERYRAGFQRLVDFGSTEDNRFVTTEVTPHHLLLDYSCGVGSMCRVNPPLRDRNSVENMFVLLKSSLVDIVASDHAPHTLQEKAKDFSEAPSGIPGTETMYPLLMKKYTDGLLSLRRLVDAVATRPAKIYGAERKGGIEVGKDADFAVFDVKNVRTIKGEDLHSKAGWTPYEGMEAVFPSMVFFRGNLMVEEATEADGTSAVNLVGERGGRNIFL